MENWLKRSEPIYTLEGIKKLEQTKMVVLGVGGVGSACAEALVRSGIGYIMIVDNDTVDITNINRQIVATRDNIGKSKVEEMKKRMLSINPTCNILAVEDFYLPQNNTFVFDFNPDYVIDAIDTVTAKLDLILECNKRNIPLLTCLGTGNRINPSMLKIGDISDTVGGGCPLARVMRKEIKKLNIDKAKVVYSLEMPYKSIAMEDSPKGRHSPASTSFVPPVAGYLMASHAVRDILGLL